MSTVACKDCGVEVHRRPRSLRVRCDSCRKAVARARQRAQRERYKQEPFNPNDPWHGTTTGYSTCGCKCEPCRAAGLSDIEDHDVTLVVTCRRFGDYWDVEILINGDVDSGGTTPCYPLDLASEILYGDKNDWLNGSKGVLGDYLEANGLAADG